MSFRNTSVKCRKTRRYVSMICMIWAGKTMQGQRREATCMNTRMICMGKTVICMGTAGTCMKKTVICMKKKAIFLDATVICMETTVIFMDKE